MQQTPTYSTYICTTIQVIDWGFPDTYKALDLIGETLLDRFPIRKQISALKAAT